MLIFILFAVASAQVCTSQETLISASYAACLDLPRCMDAFFMTPRHRMIEQLSFNDLILRVIDSAAPLTYVEICATNETFAVWTYGTLQLQHFCRDNEVWDVRYKSCVCRHDKICIDEAGGTINYGNIIANIFITTVAIGLLMLFNQLAKEAKGINQTYRKASSRATTDMRNFTKT